MPLCSTDSRMAADKNTGEVVNTTSTPASAIASSASWVCWSSAATMVRVSTLPSMTVSTYCRPISCQ